MVRPRIPDEIKMAHGTYRPGRANPSDSGLSGLCEGAIRRIKTAKSLLDPDSLAVYTEAIERIESDTPHVAGKHAVPDLDALSDIELVEGAILALLDSIGASEHIRDILRLKSSEKTAMRSERNLDDNSAEDCDDDRRRTLDLLRIATGVRTTNTLLSLRQNARPRWPRCRALWATASGPFLMPTVSDLTASK
jgi:hypothetical protein